MKKRGYTLQMRPAETAPKPVIELWFTDENGEDTKIGWIDVDSIKNGYIYVKKIHRICK